VRARALGAIALLAVAGGCTKQEAPRAGAEEESSAAFWQVECRPVRDERHQACYGPGWDAGEPRDPARFQFYQVSIERKQGEDASQVLFVKRVAAGDVDPKLLGVSAGSVASYDAQSGSVTFRIGPVPIVAPIGE
jgi:hypothetical protein